MLTAIHPKSINSLFAVCTPQLAAGSSKFSLLYATNQWRLLMTRIFFYICFFVQCKDQCDCCRHPDAVRRMVQSEHLSKSVNRPSGTSIGAVERRVPQSDLYGGGQIWPQKVSCRVLWVSHHGDRLTQHSEHCDIAIFPLCLSHSNIFWIFFFCNLSWYIQEEDMHLVAEEAWCCPVCYFKHKLDVDIREVPRFADYGYGCVLAIRKVCTYSPSSARPHFSDYGYGYV